MAAPRTVDKWKSKKWYSVIAPDIFKNVILGDTVAANSRIIPGRIVEANLSDVVAGYDSRRPTKKLRFKIKDVQGEKANTLFLGHRLHNEFERGLARKNSSKVYSNDVLSTSDGKKIRLKGVLVTTSPVNQAIKQDMRVKYQEIIKKEASSKKRDEFIHFILSGKLSGKLRSEIKSIASLKHALIQKTELIAE
ncbi:MAG: hypothetical protein CL963_03680 [Euryarchaeota archaeon]|jgi:small subunit ribosomal protein S3Ae|nr:hypothetical protein [Euryarchaeota archaeon]HIK01215.1 hypothetical protein [Candidatus Undinarchaeales archaeon ERR594346 U_76725]|tara:strand:- start:31533 stop:32111 length:579 start_codon:yes stop_codon:yes gene_type:complete